ncbi:MAG: molybdopterin cofactor-binding domain-containing protein [Pseudomonadota bacterium]
MKRRAFLMSAGAALGVGLTVTFAVSCSLPVIPKRPEPKAQDGLGWIRFIGGQYTLFLPRVEMGQNIATAMKQVACDELGVSWEQVTLTLPSTQDTERVRATVGSESIKDFTLPLAQACATLRGAIAAGQTVGELTAKEYPINQLRVFQGNRRYVGQPAVLEQVDDIVYGQPLYAADIRRPGMLFGRVLRAPVSPELTSQLSSLDETAARVVPGFVALIQDKLLKQGKSEGVGIVAETPHSLAQVALALNPQWRTDEQFEQADIDQAIDIDRRLQQGSLSYQVMGDTMDNDADWDVDLRFDIPLAAHAPIEPRAAVAEFGADGSLQLWVGAQDIFYQRDVMAKYFGLDTSKVTVHSQRVGGAFGGKTICTVEMEAAVLARAAEKPVKVQWTREQEFQYGFFRPPSSHRIRARLRDGRLDQWWHAFASSHILFTNAAMPEWLQWFTDFIGDPGVERGSQLNYRANRRRVEFDLVRLPVFTGPWRGLGAGPNYLAIESAIDECARQAAIDPITFRLQHIEDVRLARVLSAVADTAPEKARLEAPDKRHGRGVACGIYKAMSYAAVMAEVEVDAKGQVQVTRVVCAHDCGQVINPDQVRAQCEGNLMWGIGMIFTDGLSVEASKVSAMQFSDAPIPRMPDAPMIETILIDEDELPTGAGETVIVGAAGAIANAIRDATGVRLTRFPLDPNELTCRTG